MQGGKLRKILGQVKRAETALPAAAALLELAPAAFRGGGVMLDPDHPELRVGVLVWVQIDGQLSFPKPVAIEKIYEREGKKWFVVEGSATGLTADHLTLAATGADAQDPAAPPLCPAMLEPDRDQIEIFVDAIFRHAGDKGFVAVRSFLEHEDKVFRRSIADLAGGLRFLVDVCEDDARRAAQNPAPVVFCPPLAVFTGKDHAREQDVLLGLVLSVECDEHPQQARATLEALLGRATVVVQSGGRWINGGGEPEDKLHLHWRLAKPAQGKDALAKLKLARELAARLVGGDPSNAPICHPIRWPGSWHRKATPRLARSLPRPRSRSTSTRRSSSCATPLVRRHLQALASRRTAGSAPTIPQTSPRRSRSSRMTICDWDDWNKFGLAIWGATGGSDAGGEAFAAWSAKAKKNVAETTNARWQHYRTSPPDRIGFGTLVYWARHYSPGWTYGSATDVERLNKMHAVLPIGGKTRVVTFGELAEFPGRETIVMTQTIADFKSLQDKYRHT